MKNFVILSLLFACGTNPNADNKGGDGKTNVQPMPVAANTLNGTWTGFGRKKLDATPILDATLFIENSENFTIKSNTSSTSAAGKVKLYTDDNTLYMDLNSSTIQELGPTGSKQLFTYVWKSDSLTFNSSQYEFKFLKNKAEDNPTQVTDQTPDVKWKCDETTDRYWLITLKNLTEFEGRIFSSSAARLAFSGTCKGENNPRLCTVRQASDPNALNSNFFLDRNAKSLRIGKLPQSDISPLSATWISCQKQP